MCVGGPLLDIGVCQRAIAAKLMALFKANHDAFLKQLQGHKESTSYCTVQCAVIFNVRSERTDLTSEHLEGRDSAINHHRQSSNHNNFFL